MVNIQVTQKQKYGIFHKGIPVKLPEVAEIRQKIFW